MQTLNNYGGIRLLTSCTIRFQHKQKSKTHCLIHFYKKSEDVTPKHAMNYIVKMTIWFFLSGGETKVLTIDIHKQNIFTCMPPLSPMTPDPRSPTWPRPWCSAGGNWTSHCQSLQGLWIGAYRYSLYIRGVPAQDEFDNRNYCRGVRGQTLAFPCTQLILPAYSLSRGISISSRLLLHN